MGRLAEVNSNVVLAVTLWDANTTKGVRARVFNSAGTEVSGSPFTLTHRTAGHYTGTGWNPTVEGQYSVSYEVYTDGTFATPDRRYEWGAEEVEVRSIDQDLATLLSRLTAGRATNLDNLDATISSRLTTTTFNTVVGTPVTSVSADIASVKSDTNTLNATKITTARANNLDNLDATVSSRATQTSVTAIDTKLGTPVGASVSVDIASVKSDTNTLNTTKITTTRANNLDNLDTTITSRLATTAFNTVVGTPVTSVSADIASVKSDTTSTKSTVDTNLNATVASRATQVSVDAVNTKLGTPAGVSVSADIAAVKSDTSSTKSTVDTNLNATVSSRATQTSVDNINTKLGTPAGASVSVDIAAVKSDTSSTKSVVDTNLNATVASRSTQTSVDAVKAVVDTINIETDTASIAAAVWDRARASHTVVGSFGESNQGVVSNTRASNLDNLDTTVSSRASASALASVQADTDDIQSKIGVPAGVSVSADIAAVKSVVDTIDTETDTTAIAAAVWNASRASHTAAGSFGQANQGVLSATRADNLDNLDVPVSTRAGSVALASVQSDTGAIKAKTDQLAFTGGNVNARANVVADKTGYLLNSTEHDAIVDKVWDENIAAHTSAGSTGKALNDASMAGSGSLTPATISSIVDGVWNAPIAAHTLPGTTGQKLEEAGTILPAELQDIATAVWDSQLADFNDMGSMGYNINRIDNIEANMAQDGDTAKQTDLLIVKSTQATLNALFSAFRAVYTDVRGVKLDNLDASVSSRASQTSMNSGFADTAKDATVAKATQVSSVQTSVNNVQTSVNTVQSDVTSIKGTVQTTGVAVSTAAQDSIVNKVWDEPAADHVIPGTMGYDQSVAASGVITPGDITNIKNAVWDESLAAHSIPGSASEVVKTVLAVKTDTADLLGRLNPTRASNLDRLDATISSRESEASASARAAVDAANHAEILTDLDVITNDVTTINTKLGTTVTPSIGTKLDNLSSTVATVKAKTDNLPSDPASASGVVTAVQPAVTAANQANATSLAVKAKTDNLPANPAKESSVLAIPTNPVLASDGRLVNLDAPISSRAKPSDLGGLATTAQLTSVQSTLESDIAGVSLQVAQTAKPADVAAATAGMALEATLQSVKDSVLDVQDAQITPNDVWTYAPRSLTTPVDTTVDLSGLATTAQLSTATAVLSADLATWTPKLTVAIQPTLDEVTMIAWLTKEGQLITDADSAYVTVLDADDNVAFIVGPDLFVSSNGLFKFTRANASTVLQRNNTYACKVVITKGGTDYTDIVPITVF